MHSSTVLIEYRCVFRWWTTSTASRQTWTSATRTLPSPPATSPLTPPSRRDRLTSAPPWRRRQRPTPNPRPSRTTCSSGLTLPRPFTWRPWSRRTASRRPRDQPGTGRGASGRSWSPTATSLTCARPDTLTCRTPGAAARTPRWGTAQGGDRRAPGLKSPRRTPRTGGVGRARYPLPFP